jgi:hypothetical protein
MLITKNTKNVNFKLDINSVNWEGSTSRPPKVPENTKSRIPRLKSCPININVERTAEAEP